MNSIPAIVTGRPAPAGAPARRLTVGITVEHFDFRVDLHRFIEALSERADVVVFANREFKQPIRGLKEVRYYKKRRSWLAAAVSRLFHVMYRMPASRNNFIICEIFKAASEPAAQQRRRLRYLRLRRLIPWGVSVDAILPWMRWGDATPLDDIDVFLHVTQIGTLSFITRALASGKPNTAYIYSWDHPCKHITVPRRGLSAYFTWNRLLSEDMVKLQGIPAHLLQEIGATQLAPLRRYLETPADRVRLVPQDYVYYGCGVGQVDMARQEVRVIRRLAAVLREVAPALALLVRPYPMLGDWEIYASLEREPNVRLEQYRQAGQGRELTASQVSEKYNKVEHARAFIHLGTTLGWEACYFDKPVLFLALDDFDYGIPPAEIISLKGFIHQYHNDRYMILDGFPNVVRREGDLAAAVRGALERPRDFLAYNRRVAGATPLRSLPEMADDLLGRLATACGVKP